MSFNRAAHHKEWRRQNPDKVRRYYLKWRQNHPESRAKDVLRQQARRARDPEKARAYERSVAAKPHVRERRAEYRFRNRAYLHLLSSRAHARKHGGVAACHFLKLDEALAEIERWLGHKPERCEVCLGRKRLFLDHCHTTGRIRGWLCMRCNLLEGAIANGHVAKVLAYLKRTST